MSDVTGKQMGEYQILSELGRGGMGQVWKVRNLVTDRVEAMKVLLPDLAGRQDLAARFQREIKLMASLDHPNVASLRTAFTADNQLVMVMEYVEGTNLADLLRHGPIPVADAVNYIAQGLSALSYAHQQHVIHRDIKPSNMMLTPQGVVKLMDFGIARAGEERSLTMTGTRLGSLSYMSPEQVKGESTDARSDLYSMGVSLYELVTGKQPFQAASDYAIMAAHVKETPKPPTDLQPGLPPALNEIILKAIAKDPAQRFQTADDFRSALNSVAVSALAPVTSDHDRTTTSVIPAKVLPAPPVPTPVAQVASLVPAKATPVASPVPMPPAARPGGHRGLYMTLGALIVLAVLVVAGIYLPRGNKTQAGAASTLGPSAVQTSQPPAPSDTPSPDATQSPATQPPPAPSGTSLPAEHKVEKPPQASNAVDLAAQNAAVAAAEAAAKEAAAAAAAEAAAKEAAAKLDQLEQELDQLSNRAAAVNSSLDRLQHQQAGAGYGLRGDMAAKQASMKTNLAKAVDAAQRGDITRAEKFTKMAENDVEALERFLGH